jgi:hypothetical protein
MRHLFTSDPLKLEKRRRVYNDYQTIIANVETFFAGERRLSRDLSDRDAAEALDLLLATLRTEEKGILYERTSSDLRVDSLRRRLKDVIDAHLNPPEGGGERMRVAQVIESLEVIRDILASHLESGPTEMSYVDFLARLMPRPDRGASPGSSIIIPGR